MVLEVLNRVFLLSETFNIGMSGEGCSQLSFWLISKGLRARVLFTAVASNKINESRVLHSKS